MHVSVDIEKLIDQLRFLRLVKKENVEYIFNYFCNVHRSVGKRRSELYTRLMNDKII